jgi:hypothetical protein
MERSIARTMNATFSKRMGVKLATVAVAALGVLSSGVARAEPRGVDWGQILYGLDQYARGNGDKIAPTRPTKPAVRSSEDPAPQNPGNAWFGVAPRVTLVARDWNGSMRLAGDRLSLVDAMRLSASTRMVVGRARLSGTRFTPFLQLGVGQWRVDRTFLPLTPLTEEIATQLGCGFEMRVASRWQLAAETSATSLMRYGRNDSVPQTMLWSAFLASRIEF